MKPSFFKRVKRAVKSEFRRIRDEHRRTAHKPRRPSLATRFRHWFRNLRKISLPPAPKRRRPPLSVRLRRWFRNFRTTEFSFKTRRAPKPHMPPISARIRYFLKAQRKQYSVVFSSKFLIITLNSTVLYLASFFLVHFLTHLVTGIASYFSEISTTLQYTMVDFHIRYWNWTPEMVILVFSIPAIFALVLALLASLPFATQLKWPDFLKRLPYLTKKQRYRNKQNRRKKELDVQVRRLTQPAQVPEKRKQKKRLSWTIKLFLLWSMYHSLTYLFSGMLYAFLFHRRFGYVIWYAFNTYIFDLLFSVFAFLTLVVIGYVFAAQFLYSGRMYFNDLGSKNRLPFVLSQAIFPFFIGTVLTVALQIPVFDPSLILLNFSIFFLLLPLPSRAASFETLHFDNRLKTIKINWVIILLSSVIILAIVTALKIGIPIRLAQP